MRGWWDAASVDNSVYFKLHYLYNVLAWTSGQVRVEWLGDVVLASSGENDEGLFCLFSRLSLLTLTRTSLRCRLWPFNLNSLKCLSIRTLLPFTISSLSAVLGCLRFWRLRFTTVMLSWRISYSLPPGRILNLHFNLFLLFRYILLVRVYLDRWIWKEEFEGTCKSFFFWIIFSRNIMSYLCNSPII